MPLWLIFIAIGSYIALLFFIAWKGDRDAETNKTHKYSGFGFALALGVYCTSWTYFGAVGTAASSGLDYIWILMGPALLFLLFPFVIRRVGDIAQREGIASLSDFLSSRYGKSRSVAILATLAAVIGSVPYIALQLKSVGISLAALNAGPQPLTEANHEMVLITAIVMAVFAILFGARQSDLARHNPGLMRVLGFESIVKLIALIFVAVFSFSLVQGGIPVITNKAVAHFGDYSLSGRAVTIFLLSLGAAICLPRQFHIAMIERRKSQDVTVARWMFPLYLLLTSLVVIPITVVGKEFLPSTISPDLFVLNIPLFAGADILALLVFIGGFSAAMGMIVVSTIALSTMVTNDVVVPLFLENGRIDRVDGDGGERLIRIRRLAIVAIIALAYGYYRIAEDSAALAQIGLLSFAAAIQFAPALIGAVYWRKGKKRGVLVGLSLGMVIWAYTLFLPAIFGHDAMTKIMPTLLDPHALFGASFDDPLTSGVFWSLSFNIVAYIVFSLLSPERLRDRIQAVAFTGSEPAKLTSSLPLSGHINAITVDGLKALASRFLSTEAVNHSFQNFAERQDVILKEGDNADWPLIQHTEKLLTRAIGASSARIIMSSAIGGMDVDFDDVLTIFDQKSHSDRFDQHMLQSTLENISQGISVVDSEQKLVAWNGAYTDLFNYPSSLIKVGTPIQDLIEYNIRSGWIEGDNPSRQALRRVNHMKAGKPHSYERVNPDGRYIRIIGSPIPGGGYVTTFTDITEDKRRERDLIDINETLEARVEERTAKLQALSEDLNEARDEAVGANASKTRFLAAASHDLLQPLNAARLFLGAVESEGKSQELLAKADRSIQSADELLKGLLDISRLDHSKVEPVMKEIALGPLFEGLINEVKPMAAKAGIEARFVPTTLSVKSDLDFLQSILRNLLSNARRYTSEGGILLGARREGESVRIEVWDTGPGISDEQEALIFEEFQRGNAVDNLGLRGAGLGLSIVKRMAGLMEAPLGLKSSLGKGSVFSVTVPRAKSAFIRKVKSEEKTNETPGYLKGLTVLCIDDEPTILEGMKALLSRWDCHVLTSASGEAAISLMGEHDIQAVIADFQLGEAQNGLDVINTLRPFLTRPENVCLLTAQRSVKMDAAAANDNIRVLSKPSNPEDIKQFLLTCL